MRTSLAAASFAIAATMLAGCSTSSSGTPAVAGPSGVTKSSSSHFISRGSPNREALEMFRWEAEGRIPGPNPPAVLKWRLHQLETQPRPILHLPAGHVAGVGGYGTWTNFGYLVALNKRFTKTLSAINVENNECYYPTGIKVDHNGNVWVGCQYGGNYTFDYGAIQEYNSSGSLINTYAYSDYESECPSGYESCAVYGFDGGFDNKGHVFALQSSGFYQTTSVFATMGSGLWWWNGNESSQAGTFISFNNLPGGQCADGVEMCYALYMDVDGSGNVWFDFMGHGLSNCWGAGLGEVTNPTTSPSVKIVMPPCTYGFAGGIYASNGGRVLNITDQASRETLQYHLPVTSSSTPFNTLGPTKLNVGGYGDPVIGGFNAQDTRFASGDGYGWLDLIKVPTNKALARATLSCAQACLGAAYTPSDK
jgi:hypothetical protein